MLLDKAIKERRSIRLFADKEISKENVNAILEAGRWAPSSLNCQPWRFAVIKDRRTKQALAKLSHCSAAIETAPLCIALFLCPEDVHDRTECLLSAGACIQNMLLKSHALGLAACCFCDAVKKKEKFNKALLLSLKYEPMALIAIGYAGDTASSDRKELSELML